VLPLADIDGRGGGRGPGEGTVHLTLRLEAVVAWRMEQKGVE